MRNRLLTPFLLGQARQGLCRVAGLDRHAWEILDDPDFTQADIKDANEKLRRMGKIYERLADAVTAVVDKGMVPISLAGDCMSTLGVLAGLQKAGKAPDRIVWLDAHGDFHTWDTTQTQYLGGMPLAMLVGHGDRRSGNRDAIARFYKAVGFTSYPEERIILSDARDLDPGETEALNDSKIIRCAIADVPGRLTQEQSIYIHWDTDVLDAESDMRALKYHVKNGPNYGDMAALFQSLSSHNIVAISVSAWHEDQDTDNLTAKACLRLLNILTTSCDDATGSRPLKGIGNA